MGERRWEQGWRAGLCLAAIPCYRLGSEGTLATPSFQQMTMYRRQSQAVALRRWSSWAGSSPVPCPACRRLAQQLPHGAAPKHPGQAAAPRQLPPATPLETPQRQGSGSGVITTIIHAPGSGCRSPAPLPSPHLGNCCQRGGTNRCIKVQFIQALLWLLSIIASDTR